MLRKIHIISILILIITAASICSFAAEGEPFCLYNSEIVTSNENATYIQGEVADAKGQTIVVKNVRGVVAEKKVPDIGGKYVFRIKLPKSVIRKSKITSFAVNAIDANDEKVWTSCVRVEYKARKDQDIDLKEKEVELKFPGDDKAVEAASSAGLDLSYSSSDEDVVKVDEKGNIEPVGEGTAEVKVNQSNDPEYKDVTKSIKVSVKEVPHYTVRFHLGRNAADLAKDEEGNSEAAESSDDDTVIEQQIAVGDSAELQATADAKGDYEFLGWASSETGYPAYGNADEVTDLAGDGETVDLYAVWHGERAQEAVDWAIALAADNRYGYGQGTFKCNICGLMPKKQYTCMPFLAAAYAHGPRDPIMLAGGKHVINLNNKNFSGELGQIWEKVGLCKNLSIEDLEPGDVIIKWSDHNNSGHAWMYAGGDQIVEAVPAKSYANQIAVKSGAAAKLRRYGRSEGTPSKNYVMRYKY